MIEHIQIGAAAPLVHYDADGVQTAFIFPFAVFKAEEIEVWLDRVPCTAGFTLSGVGISGGGTVVFAVPPASGMRVTLRRRLALGRVSDFQTDGIIRAKTLNDELDYQVAAVQQVADDVSRCLHRPFTSSSEADLSLPEPQAGRALKWNADGSALENSRGDTDEAVAIATAQATAAAAAAAAAGADRAAVAADRVAVGADRQTVTAAAQAVAADRTAIATDRDTVATLRDQTQGAAAAAEDAAASVGARLVATSTTPLTIALGVCTLAVGTGKAWVAGMTVTVFVTAEPARFMVGCVTAYDAVSGQLRLTVEDSQGSGSASAWTVVLSGRRGLAGQGAGDLLAANGLAEIAALGAAAQQAARNNLGLAAVAASGTYADLGGRPTLGSAAAANLGTGAGQVPTAEQVPGLVPGVPTATVLPFAGAGVPSGWLRCDGAAVSRSTYAALFAVIGVTYGGGDGSTSFNLPDLCGRAPIGAGQGSGLTPRALGGKLGAETHTLASAEMPNHGHVLSRYGAYTGPGGEVGPMSSSYVMFQANPAINTQYAESTGGSGAHNNMPPSLALNFIIKT